MERKKLSPLISVNLSGHKNLLEIGTLAHMWPVKVKSKRDMTEHLPSTNIDNYTISIFQVKM